MENTEKLDHLLENFSYEALPPEDKSWVDLFVSSEEEYESMRRATMQLKDHFSGAPIAPDQSVLKSLKRHLATHQSRPAMLQQTLAVPSYAFVMLLLITGALGWWAGSIHSKEKVYVDRLVLRTDTIHIASRPDTIIVHRVVYRKAPVELPGQVLTSTDAEQSVPARGINMKEKEELEKLLVSGGL